MLLNCFKILLTIQLPVRLRIHQSVSLSLEAAAQPTWQLQAEAAKLHLQVYPPENALVAVWHPRNDVTCSSPDGCIRSASCTTGLLQ